MNDLEKAKNNLQQGNYTFVLENNGNQITSTDRGIKPMFLAVTQHPDDTNGASVADKVIGKAAAMLAAYGKIKAIYTPLASAGAVEVCKINGIAIEAVKVVEAIQNREKTGFCPMEKLASGVTTNKEMLDKVEAFLINMNAI